MFSKNNHSPLFSLLSLSLSLLFSRPNETLTSNYNSLIQFTHCAFTHSPMQDLFGSVRRSLVFRTTAETTTDAQTTNPLTPFSGGNLVERFNSCIRNSRVFTKPISPSVTMSPSIRWRKGELIGCGAFGRVYMGMNLDSGELLAVKQVRLFFKFDFFF